VYETGILRIGLLNADFVVLTAFSLL